MIRQVMHGKMMSLNEWSTNMLTCHPGYGQEDILHVSVTAALLLQSIGQGGHKIEKNIYISCSNILV